jgi:hypothetical protein
VRTGTTLVLGRYYAPPLASFQGALGSCQEATGNFARQFAPPEPALGGPAPVPLVGAADSRPALQKLLGRKQVQPRGVAQWPRRSNQASTKCWRQAAAQRFPSRSSSVRQPQRRGSLFEHTGTPTAAPRRPRWTPFIRRHGAPTRPRDGAPTQSPRCASSNPALVRQLDRAPTRLGTRAPLAFVRPER